MTVRFKFRSALTFDAVDIDGRSSISVRDLKVKILRFKNLRLYQDFDLVLSDSLTGQEYVNENVQIPDGSSVIIKRVPAESEHPNMPLSKTGENLWTKEDVNPIRTISPAVETLDFDDFGVDLYPIAGVTLSTSVLEVEKKICTECDSPDIGIPAMCSKHSVGGCQIDGSNVSDAIPQGSNHNGIEKGLLQEKVELKIRDEAKKVDHNKAPKLQNDNFTEELKCSICHSFFKEAMMIPCCQHSFCQKCINQVLLERARCPKCFSSKCRAGDLLPNLSLRQAIERLLNSQMLTVSSGHDYQQYASDEESGIQAKDAPCPVSVFQTAPALLHSPSESGRGSNHIVVESPSKSTSSLGASNHNGASDKLPHLLEKMKPIDSISKNLIDFDACQGESQPMQEEGGRKRLIEVGRKKKGVQTCYMCGSPEHFIRDCAYALSPGPMLQTGNAIFGGPTVYMAYWNAPPVPYASPYGNPYFNCGTLPSNARMVPAPFTYMSPIYHHALAAGCMRMGGGVASPLGASEDHCGHNSVFVDIHEAEKRQKLSDQNLWREPCLDNEDFHKMHHIGDRKTSKKHKSCVSKENTLSCCDESSAQRFERKYHRHDHIDNEQLLPVEHRQEGSHSVIGYRDRVPNHCVERASSQVDDVPCSSSEHGVEGKKNHYKSPSSKRSRHTPKIKKVKPSSERCKMLSGSDEDGSEEYRYYKRKRGH